MAPNQSWGQDACRVCGQVIPIREMDDHLATAHPEVVLAELKRNKDEEKPFARVMIPSFIVWLLVFGLLVFFPSIAPLETSIVAMLLVLLVIVAVAIYYAQRVTRSDVENTKLKCRICDEWVPELQLEGHTRRLHPDDARHIALARTYFAVSLVASVVVDLIFFIALTPLVGSSWISIPWIVTTSGLLIWIAFVWLWILRVDPNHVERLRISWQATHPLSAERQQGA